MHFVSFYMYCRERSCRAEVLACSASDAQLFVDCRDSERLFVVRILAYHADRSCGAVACAVSAAYAVRVHDAGCQVYDSMSYLDR